MKLISVVQQKGGVGKTTLCLNIGLYAASEGASVAIVDTDNQGSMRNLADRISGLSFFTEDELLSGSIDLHSFDMVLVDTSPRLDVNLFKILTISDYALIPVKPAVLDIEATRETMTLLSEHPELKKGIVLNMVPTTKTSVKQDALDLLEAFDAEVLPIRIHQRKAFTNSSLTNGVSNDPKAMNEIDTLTTLILERL